MAKERIPRAAMTPSERRLRSKLNQMVAQCGLVRGTLTLRQVKCGNKKCRCARGHPHPSLYLTASVNGKYRQLFIPKSLEGVARRWVKQYREAEGLLDQISSKYWDKLKKREV